MSTPELDESAQRKRDAWAEKSGTDAYLSEMGAYALRRDRAIVRSMLGHGPGRLLDIPCGTGRYVGLATKLGFQVTAADFSPTMLAAAPRQEGVDYLRADVFHPCFLPSSFEVILVSRLLFHYAHPERILAALLPALKLDGRIVCDTLNPYSTRWLASAVLGRVRKDPARRLYFERQARFEGEAAALGLEVVKKACAYLLPTRAYRLLPRPATLVAEALETATPLGLRVMTFWHLRRAGV